MGTLAIAGSVVGSAGKADAIAHDMHDDFTEAGDTELHLHVVDPLPVAAPPTWIRQSASAVSWKVNTTNEVVQGADATGSWGAYSIETGVVPAKLEVDIENGIGGGGGFLIRFDSGGANGVYITLLMSGTNVNIGFWDWGLVSQIGATQTFLDESFLSYTTYVIEDDGSTLTVYPKNSPSKAVSQATSVNNTLTSVGMYCEAAIGSVKWKDFKVYFSEAAAINAANFPSAASVFDMTTSSVSGDTATDVVASPSLSYTTDATGEGLHADGTLHGIDVNDPYNNFNESDADVASALDGPDAASPIILVCSCKWSGGIEAYARSLGYGDWKGANGDMLYVGARDQLPSVDLQAELYGDSLATQRIVSANHADEITHPTIPAKWYSHLVVVDPTVCRITHYLISEDDETVRSSTSTTTALTLPFTFQAGEAHITWHKVYNSFTGLFYPDVVPTAEEAGNILRYHYRNHIANKKHLHPWFEDRAKYS